VTQQTARYDLHMHTLHSDGTNTVEELVQQVVHAGLTGFSITDHDTTGAQAEATELAAQSELEYVTGLELSITEDDKDIHILVYGYEANHPELEARLDEFRRIRHERMIVMALRLAELGMEVDLEQVVKSAGGGALGRPHLARVLVEEGHVANIREAFDRFLATGKPAYVPKAVLSAREGMELAMRAGGVPVLAHPASYPFEPDLGALVKAGLKGVETSYPFYSPRTTAFWQQKAEEFDLVQTGGSDYHGHHRGHVQVGEATIDAEAYRSLLTARAS
jgi:predicted metal-dependent phosphoesterase TrpH